MRHDTPSGWGSYQLIVKGRRFFEEAITGQDDPGPAFRKMLMVEALGWPEAMRGLKYHNGEKLIVRADYKKRPEIWILKCKPSCWRLYFCLYQSVARGIVYLHAVCKKQDDSEPAWAAQARRNHGSLVAAGADAKDTGVSRFRLKRDEADSSSPPRLGQ